MSSYVGGSIFVHILKIRDYINFESAVLGSKFYLVTSCENNSGSWPLMCAATT